jgi:hypothetical protein
MDLEYKNDQLALDLEYNEGMLTLLLILSAGLFFCIKLDFVTPLLNFFLSKHHHHHNVGVECEGKKYLGALPIMEHIK